MIFLPGKRQYWGIKRYDDSEFGFLDKSAWPLCSLARDFINHWMTSFPDDKELISKLQSKQDKQHSAAICELLFYAICKSFGIEINRHKPHPGSKKPDFKIVDIRKKPIHVECSLASNALETDSEHRKQASVLQIVEDLVDYPFGITVRFEMISDESISKKEFTAYLKSLAEANLGLMPENRLSGEFTYSGQGWEIELNLMKKKSITERTLRAYSYRRTRTVNNYKVLYTALNDKKPAKYDIEGEPYIICLGIDDLTAEEPEFSEVLFGQSAMSTINLEYSGNGFLVYNGKPINTSVSGVIFGKSMKVLGLNAMQVTLWHNPFAAHPLVKGIFPFEELYYDIEGTKLKRTKTNTKRDIFELLQINAEEYLEGFHMKNRQPPIANS